MTGNGDDDAGYLNLKVNDQKMTMPSAYFKRNDIVLSKCFVTLDSITIYNKENDAWNGEIIVTKGGIRKNPTCLKCNGELFNGTVVVDGDHDRDYKGMAPTLCLNGQECRLNLTGMKCNKIIINNTM